MIRLLLVGGFVVLLVWLVSSSYVFRVEFKEGRMLDLRGTAPGPLRTAFEEVASHSAVTGRVSLYPGRLLKFSGSIDEADRQRFRNVLAALM